MDWVIPIRAHFVEARDQQAVAFNRDLRIAGLHRENEIVVIVLASYAGKFKGTLDHAQRRVTVTIHDAIAERAVVGPDAHGAAKVLAQYHQRREAFLDAREFRGILLVSVFLDDEFLGIGVVPRIDTHFLDPLGSFHRRFGFEMDVRDDRNMAIAPAQFGHDILQVCRVLDRRRGNAHEFATDVHQIERLLHTGSRVHRVTREH